MAKIDYEHHQRELSKLLDENPKLTVQEYCQLADLKYSSARRYLKKKVAKAKVKTAIESGRDKSQTGRKSKYDWHELLKEYLTIACQNPAFTISEFAKEKEANAATMRRTFKDMRDLPEFRSLFDLFDEKKAQLSLIKSKRRSSKTGKTVDSFQGRELRAGAHLNEAVQNRQNKSAQNCAKVPVPTPEIAQIAQSNTSASVGRPPLHGGYLSASNISLEILEAVTEIDPMSVSSELILARSNYLTMQQDMNSRIAVLETMKEEGTPYLDSDSEEQNIDNAIDRIRYGYAPRLRELEMSITQFTKAESKRYIDLRKQEFSELMTPHLLPAAQQKIVIELLAKRRQNNWTALETCQYIEELGAVPPATLLHEMKIELASIEPEVDDEGVDDEVLDLEFGQYEEEHEQQVNEWVEERKEDIAQSIQEAEDRESGLEPELSPSDIQENAETQEAYDELDSLSGGFDISDFEGVLGGESNQVDTDG